jgi:hypothetical protein
LLFFLDGDPGLAAEPGLDHQPPCGGGGVTIPIRDAFDILPELSEHLTENSLAGSSVKTKAAGRVMKDLARCEPAQAAQSSVIEKMLRGVQAEPHLREAVRAHESQPIVNRISKAVRALRASGRYPSRHHVVFKGLNRDKATGAGPSATWPEIPSTSSSKCSACRSITPCTKSPRHRSVGNNSKKPLAS